MLAAALRRLSCCLATFNPLACLNPYTPVWRSDGHFLFYNLLRYSDQRRDNEKHANCARWMTARRLDRSCQMGLPTDNKFSGNIWNTQCFLAINTRLIHWHIVHDIVCNCTWTKRFFSKFWAQSKPTGACWGSLSQRPLRMVFSF